MPRHTEVGVKNDVQQANERFLFREPIVLLSIICMSLLLGISAAAQSSQIKITWPSELLQFLGLSSTAGPILGMVFIAFLSELHGRKPVFIIIFILLIFSSVLNCFPWQACLILGFTAQGMLTGANLIMSGLAICEYCCAKHRFTYLLANAAASDMIGFPMTILLIRDILNPLYVQGFQVVLGLVCLGSMRMWPESPYWLASKGRLEESRRAFLWLRGEEGRKELDSVMEERRRPGPLKLYWKSFLVAIATTTLTLFSYLQVAFSSIFFDKSDLTTDQSRMIIFLCSCIVICSLIALISYFIRRKILYVVVSAIPLAFSYTVGIWLCVNPEIKNANNKLFDAVYLVSDVLLRCGSAIVARVLFSEVIPQKYNTHMYCIGMVYQYLFYNFFLLCTYKSFYFDSSSSSHSVYIIVFTTLLLVGVILYYCYSPESKDKTLLEIQKLYTPELNAPNSGRDQVMMQNVES